MYQKSYKFAENLIVMAVKVKDLNFSDTGKWAQFTAVQTKGLFGKVVGSYKMRIVSRNEMDKEDVKNIATEVMKRKADWKDCGKKVCDSQLVLSRLGVTVIIFNTRQPEQIQEVEETSDPVENEE